jgi:hypothetical protein
MHPLPKSNIRASGLSNPTRMVGELQPWDGTTLCRVADKGKRYAMKAYEGVDV